MFMRNGVTYEFHHLGIPTTEVRPGERYSAMFGMYTSDADSRLVRVQYHRYEPSSPLPELLRILPHPAFRVDDLERAVQGFTLLLGPYEPIDGFRVAVIDDGGHPVELIETSLPDDEVWGRAHAGQGILYAAPGKPE
ncbi:hypothetical protein GCM10011289_28140 [Paludibacterium paludis]|uniref:Uncharacterized protein n=2 Tax=Paludibacterium paludis TaxID=1225769 RepID=A0A918P4L3_9NEIS|nr:hypothetical protein GCM10011289_28140 [Paludibacterium paludis]